MSLRFSLLNVGLRHLLLAVAVVATLVSTSGALLLDAHVHAALISHQHGATHGACHGEHVHDVGVELVSDVGSGESSTDADGCDHCHCPVPSADLPTAALHVAASPSSRVVRGSHDDTIPDGMTFQPDPPPAKG